MDDHQFRTIGHDRAGEQAAAVRPGRRGRPARPRRHLALLVPGLLALAGCTSQAWYEGARVSAETQCQQQPPGAYEECMSRVNRKSYEDYRREREAVKQAP